MVPRLATVSLKLHLVLPSRLPLSLFSVSSPPPPNPPIFFTTISQTLLCFLITATCPSDAVEDCVCKLQVIVTFLPPQLLAVDVCENHHAVSLITDDNENPLPSNIELLTPSLSHITECIIQIFAKPTPIIIGPLEWSDPSVTRNMTARRCAHCKEYWWSDYSSGTQGTTCRGPSDTSVLLCRQLGIESWLRAVRPTNRGWIPGKGKGASPLQSTQVGFEGY